MMRTRLYVTITMMIVLVSFLQTFPTYAGNIDSDLWFAVRRGDAAQVRALLDKGADVNATDEDGDTVLMQVLSSGHTDVLNVLLEYGLDVNARDRDGHTALLRAPLFGYIDIVKVLLEHGADVNTRDPDGQTALMHAAEEGRSEIMCILLKHGADMNATDKDGQTALMIAQEADHPETVDILEQYCINRYRPADARPGAERVWLPISPACVATPPASCSCSGHQTDSDPSCGRRGDECCVLRFPVKAGALRTRESSVLGAQYVIFGLFRQSR